MLNPISNNVFYFQSLAVNKNDSILSSSCPSIPDQIDDSLDMSKPCKSSSPLSPAINLFNVNQDHPSSTSIMEETHEEANTKSNDSNLLIKMRQQHCNQRPKSLIFQPHTISVDMGDISGSTDEDGSGAQNSVKILVNDITPSSSTEFIAPGFSQQPLGFASPISPVTSSHTNIGGTTSKRCAKRINNMNLGNNAGSSSTLHQLPRCQSWSSPLCQAAVEDDTFPEELIRLTTEKKDQKGVSFAKAHQSSQGSVSSSDSTASLGKPGGSSSSPR